MATSCSTKAGHCCCDVQGQETPTEEAPYETPEGAGASPALGPNSMMDTSRLSDFAAEAASQSSIQGDTPTASGGLESQKSGRSSGPLCCRASPC